jgi:zinc D-Ala-D-Ala dipeptidase
VDLVPLPMSSASRLACLLAGLAACSSREPPAPRTAAPAAPAPVVEGAPRAAPAPKAIVEPPASPAAPAPAAPPADDDFVDVALAIPDAVLDLRYATEHNFTRRKLYPVARCLLRRAVAARLALVAERLRNSQGREARRLLLWDCYRPASIQLALWELVPNPAYVARPKFAADGTPISGSRHSRGAAVDLSLADAAGAPIAMPTDHDDFSSAAAPRRAFAAQVGGPEARRLATAMAAEGFLPIASEWWHFDAPDSASYGFSDAPLDAPLDEPLSK